MRFSSSASSHSHLSRFIVKHHLPSIFSKANQRPGFLFCTREWYLWCIFIYSVSVCIFNCLHNGLLKNGIRILISAWLYWEPSSCFLRVDNLKSISYGDAILLFSLSLFHSMPCSLCVFKFSALLLVVFTCTPCFFRINLLCAPRWIVNLITILFHLVDCFRKKQILRLQWQFGERFWHIYLNEAQKKSPGQ